MSDNLALSLARIRVHAYADASGELMKQHAEAMECRDCEDFLKMGIEAYQWLQRAEDTMREADYAGIFEFTRETRETLDTLYVAWLKPCEFAEKWIASLNNRSYFPDNLSKFRDACERAQESVQNRDWQNRATNTRVLGTAEESW